MTDYLEIFAYICMKLYVPFEKMLNISFSGLI